MTSAQVYRRLLAYLRPYVWPRVAVAIVCMLIYSSSNAVMPFIVKAIFGDWFHGAGELTRNLLPLLIIGVFAVRGVANFGNNYLMEFVGQRVITDLRDALNDRIQHLPLSYFNRTATGTIISRMTNDVWQVRSALTEAAVSILRDSTSLVLLMAVVIYQDWLLSLIAFVAFPLTVLPVMRLSKRLKRYSRRGQATLGTLTALLQETIQGNRIVKAFGMEEYEKQRFAEENRRLFRLYMKASWAKALVQPLMELLAALGIAGVVWYGSYSMNLGGRTPESFLAFLTALLLVYDPFKGLARTGSQMQQGLASAERIFELLDEPTDVVERSGAFALPLFAREIRFEGVSFRYPPRSREGDGQADESAPSPLALRDVSLALAKGEALALVGMSGGGKSTLADLIPRFYDPTFGRITIDGTDLREVTLASLRAQIGIVTQFTFLFNDTVKANIAYGSTEPSMAAIEAAARAANAHDFIMELPDGYSTIVGELGVTLSGGQRQRIAIARALLKNAPILILDEATSALDSESERLVQDAIDRLMAGRTTLVIAHRLATIRRAGRIAVIADGRIVEEGTHDDLLARGAVYRRLHEQQMLGQEAGRVESAARSSLECA